MVIVGKRDLCIDPRAEKLIGPVVEVQWLEQLVEVEAEDRRSLHTRRSRPHLPNRRHRTNMIWPQSISLSWPD